MGTLEEFKDVVRSARRVWMEENPCEDGRDHVTPFDRFLGASRLSDDGDARMLAAVMAAIDEAGFKVVHSGGRLDDLRLESKPGKFGVVGLPLVENGYVKCPTLDDLADAIRTSGFHVSNSDKWEVAEGVMALLTGGGEDTPAEGAHSCSYYCQVPAHIKSQRDYLAKSRAADADMFRWMAANATVDRDRVYFPAQKMRELLRGALETPNDR